LTTDCKLDRGNANQAAIANDFGLLGISRLWAGVDAINRYGKGRRANLDLLMTARNAIAHGNTAKRRVLVELDLGDEDAVRPTVSLRLDELRRSSAA